MDLSQLELKFLTDLESLANNKHVDQLVIIKSLVQLVFCTIKQLSQFSFLFNNMKKEIDESMNETLKNMNNEIQILKESQEQYQKQLDHIQKLTIQPKDFEPNLSDACRLGKLSSVEWIVEKNIVENSNKNNFFDPLRIACEKGHLPVVEYLISKVADVNAKDDYQNILQYACDYGHIPIVEFLIAKGADVHAKDRNGNSAIHYASKKGLLPIVQNLIEKQNVDINIKGSSNWTPLHYACDNYHIPVIEYLTSKGADINARETSHSWTPLLIASYRNKPEIIKLLVSKGAYINVGDKGGLTPLHYAAINSNVDIIRLLLSNGADKNATTTNYCKPYELTHDYKIKDMLR